MTKKFSFAILAASLFLTILIPIQSYSQSVENLAVKGNYSLNETHVQFYVELLQFVIGEKIKKSEINQIRDQAISEFNNNPQGFFNEMNQFQTVMTQLQKQTDPIQIANGRMMFISHFYKVTSSMPEQNLPSLIKIANRYVKVLHYNPQTQIALTNKDIKAVLEYINFTRKLSGYNGLSYAEKQNFKKHLPNFYAQLNPQQQAVFVVMPIFWKTMETQWNRMSPQQKQQVMAQYRSAQNNQMAVRQNQTNTNGNYQNQQSQQTQTNSPYLNQLRLQQRQQMFNMMNDINTSSHITTMNIIENIGDSGGYWTLDNNY